MAELHDRFAELERRVGTHLYGRRMFETMAVWEEFAARPYLDPVMRRFADVWVDAENIVFSRTLDSIDAPRTTLAGEFDVEAVRRLKSAATRDLEIGGPELAAQALKAGLVDQVILTLAPVVLGGGRRALPDGVMLDLELLETQTYSNGTVLVRYRVRPGVPE